MQEIDRTKLSSAVSYVLIALKENLEKANTDSFWLASKNRLISEVFRNLYTADRQLSGLESVGFKVIDERKALEMLKGEHGKDVAELATFLVQIMISYENPIPKTMMLWLRDVLHGSEKVYRLGSVKASKLGRSLLFRHLARVSAEQAACRPTSKNEGVVTGAMIVRECLLQYGEDISVGTLNREVSTAKNDCLYNDFILDSHPRIHADNVMTLYLGTEPQYCAKSVGLEKELDRVMTALTNLERVQLL